MTKATITRPKKTTKAKPEVRPVRTFRSAVNFLDSLINYERVPSVRYTPSNFGIARMSRIVPDLVPRCIPDANGVILTTGGQQAAG